MTTRPATTTLRRLAAAVALSAVALALAAPGAGAYPRSGKVTATSFGSIRHGMTARQVRARWGAPTSTRGGRPWSSMTYGRGRSRIVLRFYRRRFDDATTRLPGYRFRGVGPGMSWEQARARIPGLGCSFSVLPDWPTGCYVGSRIAPRHEIYLVGPQAGPITRIWLVGDHVS